MTGTEPMHYLPNRDLQIIQCKMLSLV